MTFLRPAALATLCVLALACQLVQAQVYRCGKDGREYSQTPCAEGRAVDADDARSAAQQQAGRDTATREKRLAAELARERQARDAAAVPGVAALGPKRVESALKPAPLHPKKPGKKKKKHGAAPDDPNLSEPVRGAEAKPTGKSKAAAKE